MVQVKNYTKIHTELHNRKHQARLNWLRAGVLGANDGIVSTAGLVIGVAGATQNIAIILTAGIAGIVAGTISMATGEYISVSSSRDAEKALLNKERFELKNYPKEELEELTQIYQKKGLSRKTAEVVAKELTRHDVHAAHFDAELGIDPKQLTNPWHAALASAISFLTGALIPLVVIVLPPANIRIPFAFASVVIALILTGIISAKIGGAGIIKAVVRVVIGGLLAMVVTYIIGRIFNIQGI